MSASARADNEKLKHQLRECQMNRTFLIAGGAGVAGVVVGVLIWFGLAPSADDYCDEPAHYCVVVSVDNQQKIHVNIDELHKSGVGQIRWSIAKSNRPTYQFHPNDAIVFKETNAVAGFNCPTATDGIRFQCDDIKAIK